MIITAMLLLPVAGAVIAPLAGMKKDAAREFLLRLFTLAELGLAGWLFFRVWNGGEEIVLSAPGMIGLGLSFRVDVFRALYALLACNCFYLAVAYYS